MFATVELVLAFSSLAAAGYAVERAQHVARQASATSIDAGTLSACIPPSSILEPTILSGAPTPPADVIGYYATMTDYCQALQSVPASVSSDLYSYASAVSSWEQTNGPAITSWEMAAQSWYTSALSNSVCASLLGGSEVAAYTSAYGTAAGNPLASCVAMSNGAMGSASKATASSTSPAKSSGASSTSTGSAASTTAAPSGSAASAAGSSASASSSAQSQTKSAASSLAVPSDAAVFVFATLSAATLFISLVL